MTTFKRFFKEAVLPQQTKQVTQGGGKVTQSPGATRNLPLSQGLVAAIQKGLAGTGLDWHSYSGGQPAKGSGGKRVGSTRHDNGRASDGYFKDAATGRVLDGNNTQDRQRIAAALGKLRQSGIQGIGWGAGYMGTKNFHLDIVSPEIWGAGGKSSNAAPWVVAAAGGSVLPPASGDTVSGQGGQGGGAEGEPDSSTTPGGGESTDLGSMDEILGALQGAVDVFTGYGKNL